MKKNKTTKLKGMTFVEAIIGIFIFGVVMIAVTNIFTSSFNGYKKAEKMAKNIENAQYAMSVMTKSLRTSKIHFISASAILAYDYSEVACNEYSFSGGQITRKKNQIAYLGLGDCDLGTSVATPITTQFMQGSFSGAPSANDTAPIADTMGKVTIRVKVCSEANCPVNSKNDTANLQTTVSLRDYQTVGL